MVDLIVIGAGPAGLTAALYATRAGASVIVLDGGAPGGKLNLTAEIENYPGVVKKGPELAYSMYEQCLSFGAKYEFGEVTKIEDLGDHKIVYTAKEKYETKYVFIATGTKERKMGISGEEEMTGHGVSYCAVCDGPFFKNKVVCVVGGGNSAIEESLYLSDIASHVHIIVRRDVLRADQYLIDKMKEKDNIEMHYLKKPHAIEKKDGKVSGLVIEDSKTGELSTIPTNGIFPFIGLDPISGFVSDLGIVDDKGYIEVNENQETKVKGIFAGGDVTAKNLRQVITAANDGAIAGQYIASLLK
ncbi:MAG: thioredoxin-disulfide reductase [Longibaculum muris]|uniref:Thioredoxin reductase n=1 Tax=Longibaculum muris TaxID=1796628 RepID=A0A4R3YVQ4_9FIRM|nr:thioredoxin-disulfide reductase [Longibaculum muris]KXU52034.1 thioredoxin-disulfide reductase [Candidatus Stoquefichus sp. KLE1796]MBS5370325.1 thioredoxin-disulfide reductase [Coprobacillus cateniformis]MCR1888806.1 thioredoxin-disulfide reductase [Longibaculum muris]MED9813456.1 thioredoxin-disulfide reductase [Longibaculum muris]TCV95313.1 thioredoxin reductase (NADPH) [Longibaculum muris]